MMDEMEQKQTGGKFAQPEAPSAQTFEEQFRAKMAELGRKGGKVSGAKRMQMPKKKRREIALKAAQARWSKKEGR